MPRWSTPATSRMWSRWSATVDDGGDGARGASPRRRGGPSSPRGWCRGGGGRGRACCRRPRPSSRRRPGRTNFGTNVTIAMPPLAGSRSSTSSGMLRGWSQTARAEEWEKITGALGRVERVPHGGRRHVREVDQHAEAVHLPDDLAAEGGQTADARLVGRRVRPGDVVVVGERHVAHAERVQPAQRAERVVDGVAALGAHQRGDTALARGPPPCRRPSARARRSRRVAGDQLPYAVDLLQRRA